MPEDMPRWAAAGFIRFYRRRFREVLVNQQQHCKLGRSALVEFGPERSGTALELVSREIEDILFVLAALRTRTNGLPDAFDPPWPEVWEAHEPLVSGSTDPAVQSIHAKLRDFYERYAELLDSMRRIAEYDRSKMMTGRNPALAGQIRARIIRLDIIGTQVIWAIQDARSGNRAPEIASSTAGKAWPRERAVHLRRLRLVNVRRFPELEIDLHVPDEPDRGQWVLLLGNNGTGKSTILRAIALALMDEEIGRSLVTQFSGDAPLVRLEPPGPGRSGLTQSAKSWVEVQLDPPGLDATIHLEPFQGRERMLKSAEPDWIPPVFAYGCRRGSALGGPDGEADVNPVENAATLFDPQASLLYAEAWLRRLAFAAQKSTKDEALFAAVLDLLTDSGDTKYPLLPGVRTIDVEPDRTWVTGPGEQRVPLSALSDGYLTTLGWLADFLARWLAYARQSGYEIGPGFATEMPAVVLVDEIDLHLHPRWQVQVVPALARTFPRTTFVATTHNPLTLNGSVLEEHIRKGVYVIREAEDGTLQIEPSPLPKGRRVDEVLTGDWFDLRSTLDPDTFARLEEHRQLLRQNVPENDPRRQELEAELRRRLDGYADTPAERLAQELVARQFPDDETPSEEEIEALHKLYDESLTQARKRGGSPEKP